MTFTHALSTNRYGEGDLIVSTSAANGTHTTLASAMAAAVSGQTIFLRDSVTENVTLTAGVNISAWTGGTLNTPTIIGKLTMTAAGTCNISGIRLQTNSDFFLAVTGSANSIINLKDCYLNASNNTGISYTSSGASSSITMFGCQGDIGTTGIGHFTSSGAGGLTYNNCNISNTGGSSTASTASAGTIAFFRSNFNSPITTTSTAGILCYFSNINAAGTNSTAITHGGSGAANECALSWISGGTASAISIGASLGVHGCEVISSNTNAITGAGTLIYTAIFMGNTSTAMNVTTTTQRPSFSGGISFDKGVNTLNVYTTGTFNPTITASGVGLGSTTYSVQAGFYTKIGDVAFVTSNVTLSAVTVAPGTGSIRISGLPFTANAAANSQTRGTLRVAQIAFGGYLYGSVSGGTTNADIQNSTTGAAVANLAVAALTATTDLECNNFYKV